MAPSRSSSRPPVQTSGTETQAGSAAQSLSAQSLALSPSSSTPLLQSSPAAPAARTTDALRDMPEKAL